MKKISLFSSLILLSSVLFAQEVTRKFKVTEFQVQNGFELSGLKSGEWADFRKLAPNSVMLGQDFSAYRNSEGYIMQGNGQFSAYIGVQRLDKLKGSYISNPTWRIGISHGNLTLMSGALSKETKLGSDTMKSAQSGQVIWTDTTSTSIYSMGYETEQLKLDISAIFRTDPAARWSFYTGLGLSAGFSIQSSTVISHSRFNTVKTYFQDNINYSSIRSFTNDFEYDFESNDNQMNSSYSLYIPLGVDFRLGKKRELLKKMHISMEIRPSLNFNIIPELGNLASTSSQQRLGLRMVW